MAKLFKPDHARRIELEGVGPAPRPVDIDQAQTGFEALRTLRIYRFAPTAVIHGHAEEDEVFIVVLEGEAALEMRSHLWSNNDRRFTLKAADPAAQTACAAYLPPHAEYSLTPRTGADVAYVRALAAGGRSPAIFSTSPRRAGSASSLLLDPAAYAERLRLQLWYTEALESAVDLGEAGGREAMADTLIHIRSTPARAVTVEAQRLSGVTLDSWDTLGVCGGERTRLCLAAGSSALSLVVSAA